VKKIAINFFVILIILIMSFTSPESQAQENLAPFEKDGKWGYINGKGQVVIEPQFIIACEFSPEKIAPVVDDNGWAYIDMKGNIVIRPFIFDNGPDYFREGLARFTVDNKFGFFDTTGKIVIRPQFDWAFPFSEGLAVICTGCKKTPASDEHYTVKGGKWGYINKEGKAVIPPRFDDAGTFENGRARAKVNGKWMYIDKKGEIVSASD
jgi:hypothetical protein